MKAAYCDDCQPSEFNFFLPLENYWLSYLRIQEKEKIYLYRVSWEVFQVEVSLYLGQMSDSEVVNLFQVRGSPDEDQKKGGDAWECSGDLE